MKTLILFLFLSFQVFAQNQVFLTLFGEDIPNDLTMDTDADSVKAHWVFDSLYLADNSRTVFENLKLSKLYFSTETITNGSFTTWSGDNPSSWSVSGENATNLITQNPTGQARFTQDGSSYLYMEQGTSSADTTYYFNFDLNAMSTGGIMINQGSGTQRDYNPTSSGVGNKTWIVKQGATVIGTRIQRTATLSGYSTIDNFSRKKVWGTNYLVNNYNCDLKNNWLKTSPVYKNGKILNLDFDYGQYGDAWYIDVARCTYLNPALNSFTIEIKVNATNFDAQRYLVAKHEADGSPCYYLRVETDSTVFFKVTSADGSTAQIQSTAHLTRNKWHYISAVLNRADNTIKIYLDGEAVVSGSSATISGKTIEPNYQFCIGQIAPSSATTFLGYIAELRFSNRALSSNEILQHWNYIKPKFNQLNQ